MLILIFSDMGKWSFTKGEIPVFPLLSGTFCSIISLDVTYSEFCSIKLCGVGNLYGLAVSSASVSEFNTILNPPSLMVVMYCLFHMKLSSGVMENGVVESLRNKFVN